MDLYNVFISNNRQTFLGVFYIAIVYLSRQLLLTKENESESLNFLTKLRANEAKNL